VARIWEKLLTRSSLENPSTSLVEFLTGAPVSSGVTVSSQTTLGLPAIWRGVRLMSSVVASLPLGVFENTAEGKKKRTDHDIFSIIKNPNPYMTGYTWREISMFHAHFWGNSYSLISNRQNGVPTELLPFHPKDVTPVVEKGKLWYVFSMDGTQHIIEPLNVVHVKGLGSDGIKGKDIVTLLKENLGLGLAQQQNASDFFGSGSKLKYVITQGEGKALSAKGVKNLRKSWKKVHGGVGGEDVAFLDIGQDIKQIQATPEESQNIQSRKFSVTDVSRILGIPPPLLYDLERSTFSNIEKLILSFTVFDLNPWTVNIEAEYDTKLFKESEKLIVFTEHNLEGLLRGDPKTRSEFYQKMIMYGIMSPNEVRRLENMNPYEGGDVYYVPQNMAPVMKKL